jgi:hypothetical protein
MIFPAEAERWVGAFVVLEWNEATLDSPRKRAANSGGRVLRIDDTYLYLQPFGLSPRVAPGKPGDPVTRLGLKVEEEKIPLYDIETIYAAPLDGMAVEE